MRYRKTRPPAVSTINGEVSGILARAGNRLLLIEGWMVCLTVVLMYQTLQSVDSLFWMAVSSAYNVPRIATIPTVVLLQLLLTLFLTLPLFIGLMGMAAETEQGREVCLADLFAPFSTGRAYRRALGISFDLWWKIAILVPVVKLTFSLFDLLMPEELSLTVLVLGAICGLSIVAEVAVGIFACLRGFPLLAMAHRYPELPLRELRRRAGILRRAFPRCGFRFFFDYLPRMALGLLTVGILLLADVLPRMCVAYFRYCNKMTEHLIRLEEDKHE